MYASSHFTVTDKRKLVALMKTYPFGCLVVPVQDNYPEATHLPFMIHEKGEEIVLRGHMMKASPHYKSLQDGHKVRVIFNGPQGYISASWYSQPQQASTWNYMSVHALGAITFLDEDGTLESIRDLTDVYEGKSASGSFDQIHDDYIRQHLKAIVGFEIQVDKLAHVFKLSQNKDETTRQLIISALRKRAQNLDLQLADAMEQNV